MLFSWLVFLILGIVITAVSTVGPETLESFCAQEKQDHEQLDWLAQGVYNVDYEINRYAGEYMCSAVCPCLTSSVQPWTKIAEDTLNSYNRTRTQWDRQSLQDDDGRFYLVHTNSPQAGEEIFKNFTQCN